MDAQTIIFLVAVIVVAGQTDAQEVISAQLPRANDLRHWGFRIPGVGPLNPATATLWAHLRGFPELHFAATCPHVSQPELHAEIAFISVQALRARRNKGSQIAADSEI